MAVSLAAQALPLQSAQEMNARLRVCEVDLMHNSRGLYVTQNRAERVCACGVNKVSKWVRVYGATTVPPEAERGAGISCMHEVGREDRNRV